MNNCPGPKTVNKVKDNLAALAGLAFLGKKAFMEGDLGEEGWKNYLESIDCPWRSVESLAENAFEGLLKLASQGWEMLFDPEDEAPPLSTLSPGLANAKVSVAALWKHLEDLEAVADDPAKVKEWASKIHDELGKCQVA